MSGHNTSLASTLPFWDCQDGREGTLKLICPRCGGKAIVNKRVWLNYRDAEGRGYIGRSCTYCFKTARVPDKILPHLPSGDEYTGPTING